MENLVFRPSVAIVVPVYNVESFLAKCLDSCLNQTYKNFVIICINDGSNDNSPLILETYQKRYPEQIFVADQANRGVSAARNHGLEICTADYVTFVDSDDYIDPDYVEGFVCEATDRDLVLSTNRGIRGGITFWKSQTGASRGVLIRN